MPATAPETTWRVLACAGAPRERQRIETGNRTRTHGENVAQNATDAGGRALIGLNVAWMVMALHLEHDREPVADIDHAGVLARPLDHPRRLRRQRAQVDFRRLVRAVLVPHRRNADGDRSSGWVMETPTLFHYPRSRALSESGLKTINCCANGSCGAFPRHRKSKAPFNMPSAVRMDETCDIIGPPSVYRVLQCFDRMKVRFGRTDQQRGLMTVLAATGVGPAGQNCH